jgi:antitoxin PrlF
MVLSALCCRSPFQRQTTISILDIRRRHQPQVTDALKNLRRLTFQTIVTKYEESKGRKMQESTVTVKGQTTLPRGVRAALGVGSGDRVRYIILDGEVRILKARPAGSLAGLLADPNHNPVTLEAMDVAIAAGASDTAK